MTNTQKQMVRNMRRRGKSYSAIAASFGFSENTIKSFCRRESINVINDPDNENLNLCKNCGAQLTHHPGSKKKIFCSDKCRYGWWNKNRVWTGAQSVCRLTCYYCGAEFESTNKKRKYCGRECYIQSRYGEELP